MRTAISAHMRATQLAALHPAQAAPALQVTNLFTPLAAGTPPPAFLADAATALKEYAAEPWMGMRLPYAAPPAAAAACNPATAAEAPAGAVVSSSLPSGAHDALAGGACALLARTHVQPAGSSCADEAQGPRDPLLPVPTSAAAAVTAPQATIPLLATHCAADGAAATRSGGAALHEALSKARQPPSSQPTAAPLPEPAAGVREASPCGPPQERPAAVACTVSSAPSFDAAGDARNDGSSSSSDDATPPVVRHAVHCGGEVACRALQAPRSDALTAQRHHDVSRRGPAAALQPSVPGDSPNAPRLPAAHTPHAAPLDSQLPACDPAGSTTASTPHAGEPAPPARPTPRPSCPAPSLKRPGRISRTEGEGAGLRVPSGPIPANAAAVRKKQRIGRAADAPASGPLTGDGGSAAAAILCGPSQRGRFAADNAGAAGASAAAPTTTGPAASGGADAGRHRSASVSRPRLSDACSDDDAGTPVAATGEQHTAGPSRRSATPAGKKRRKTPSDAGAPWTQRSILEFATRSPLSASPVAPVTRARGRTRRGSDGGTRQTRSQGGDQRRDAAELEGEACIGLNSAGIAQHRSSTGPTPRQVVDLCSSEDE